MSRTLRLGPSKTRGLAQGERVVLLVAIALALAACRRERPEPTLLMQVDRALVGGGGFLAAQVGADGAVRASPYAALRDGASLTPLALAALRFAPPTDATDAAYRRGVDYVASLAAPGAPAPSYPLYATALGVIVLNAPGNERHRAARDAQIAALLKMQLTDDVSRGGWGYDDRSANLSATLVAIGALALGGVAVDHPALVAARGFVDRCQNLTCPGCDGGFFFSPVILDTNKAGVAEGDAPRSYGSMTADGVRALLRLGVPPGDPRVTAAAAWLEKRFDPAHNPGDFPSVNEVRRESSYYYWAWTAAHALRALDRPVLHTERGDLRWAEALAAELIASQGDDGTWRNRYTEMREDDPVVATSFAMAALSVARGVITGEYRSHAAVK